MKKKEEKDYNYEVRFTIRDVQLKDINKVFQSIEPFFGKQISVSLKDPIGGIHTDGIGISPKGDHCNKCSYLTCEDCALGREQYMEMNGIYPEKGKYKDGKKNK